MDRFGGQPAVLGAHGTYIRGHTAYPATVATKHDRHYDHDDRMTVTPQTKQNKTKQKTVHSRSFLPRDDVVAKTD